MTARFVSGVAVALVCAAGAHADTVDLKLLGTAAGKTVKITHNGNTKSVFAGQLRHQFSNGVGLGAQFNGEYLTFCTEITQHATSSIKTYNVVDPEVVSLPPIGSFKSDALRNLYSFVGDAPTTVGANADFAAAFQIAVWEIVYDFSSIEGASSLDVADGAFTAVNTNNTALSATIMGHLATFFAAALSSPIQSYTLYGLENDTAQDQLIAVPIGDIVPLPTAGLMGLAGMGVLAARRRRG